MPNRLRRYVAAVFGAYSAVWSDQTYSQARTVENSGALGEPIPTMYPKAIYEELRDRSWDRLLTKPIDGALLSPQLAGQQLQPVVVAEAALEKLARELTLRGISERDVTKALFSGRIRPAREDLLLFLVGVAGKRGSAGERPCQTWNRVFGSIGEIDSVTTIVNNAIVNRTGKDLMLRYALRTLDFKDWVRDRELIPQDAELTYAVAKLKYQNSVNIDSILALRNNYGCAQLYFDNVDLGSGTFDLRKDFESIRASNGFRTLGVTTLAQRSNAEDKSKVFNQTTRIADLRGSPAARAWYLSLAEQRAAPRSQVVAMLRELKVELHLQNYLSPELNDRALRALVGRELLTLGLKESAAAQATLTIDMASDVLVATSTSDGSLDEKTFIQPVWASATIHLPAGVIREAADKSKSWHNVHGVVASALVGRAERFKGDASQRILPVEMVSGLFQDLFAQLNNDLKTVDAADMNDSEWRAELVPEPAPIDQLYAAFLTQNRALKGYSIGPIQGLGVVSRVGATVDRFSGVMGSTASLEFLSAASSVFWNEQEIWRSALRRGGLRRIDTISGPRYPSIQQRMSTGSLTNVLSSGRQMFFVLSENWVEEPNCLFSIGTTKLRTRCKTWHYEGAEFALNGLVPRMNKLTRDASNHFLSLLK